MVVAASLTFSEQRQNVIQLSRDRKNAIGGYAAGLKDFAEMGPPSGEHWPLSAEQIKRAFGVPQDRDDPDSEYVLLLRAESHALLEKTARELKDHVPELWRAWDAIFDLDDGGDRDHEWYRRQAEKYRSDARALRATADQRSAEAKELLRKSYIDASKQRERDASDARSKSTRMLETASRYARLIYRCDRFIDLLTIELIEDDLLVEFSTRMSRLEEEKMERENDEIWDRYQDLLSRKTMKESKTIVTREYGISERTLARIEESVRTEQGLPKRPKGRPKKGETS